jgi:hypothetical protein
MTRTLGTSAMRDPALRPRLGLTLLALLLLLVELPSVAPRRGRSLSGV